jgi:putative transposase
LCASMQASPHSTSDWARRSNQYAHLYFVQRIYRKTWISRRWAEHDYRGPGRYFVTLCTVGMKHYFGKQSYGYVSLSPAGQLVESEWREISNHFPHVRLDALAIMPNHLHGILVFDSPGSNLGSVVGGFKAGVSRKLGQPIWQPYFYDHVIRNDIALAKIQLYIGRNPMHWPWHGSKPETARFAL